MTFKKIFFTGWKESKEFFKDFFYDYKLLLRSVPGLVTTFFCMSVVLMNLMANKTIINTPFIATDGGFLLSWVPFLCMDTVTKRYGPKAANKLTLLALVINLFCVGIFALVSAIYIEAGEVDHLTFNAFDSTFSCTWFVLLASSTAFLVSGIINNILNWGIGKSFTKNPDGKLAFVTRSYISTFIGQFIDNMIFGYITFYIFAPIYWGYQYTFPQVLGSALVGATLELVMEIVFSPIGYRLSKKWKDEGIGNEYMNWKVEQKEKKFVEAC